MKNLLLLIIAFHVLTITNAQVKTKLINYKGWNKTIELTNDEIRVVVVPQIGRIIHFSYVNESNILYENPEMEGKTFSVENPYTIEGELAHANFGGDRIWPCKQDNFKIYNGNRGLSDPWIDGSAWKYECVENGVKITSQVSKYLGVKVTRTITLNKNGSTVNIQQKMEKVQLGEQKNLEPIPVVLWSLSKVKNPEFGLLPLRKNSIFENGIDFQKWPDNTNSAPKNYSQHGNVGQLMPVPALFQKMGADSKGWVAGLYKNMVFGQFFTFNKNETYPDGGTSATIFTCTDFTELECLSPEKKLSLGETLEFNTQWKLIKIAESSSDKKREIAVKWLNKQLKNKATQSAFNNK